MKIFHREILSSKRWFNFFTFIIILWVIVLITSIWITLCSKSSKIEKWDKEYFIDSINKTSNQLEIVKRQNDKLIYLLNSVNFKNLSLNQKPKFLKQIYDAVNVNCNNDEFSATNSRENNIEQIIEYESVRRRVQSNVQEFWNFIQSEISILSNKQKNINSEVFDSLQNILELGMEQKRSLLNDLQKLKRVDGFEERRQLESIKLSKYVQKRIHSLQNPERCITAKKIVCNLNKGCGFGCQLHHVVYCLILAYGTERVLILDSKNWLYHKNGWEQMFLPLSETCTSPDGETIDSWPGKANTQVINLPTIDAILPRPNFLPLAIPSDIATKLQKFHGAPYAWWVGQLLKYLLRPQPTTVQLIQNSIKRLDFKKPIVGVHVRRTDKVGTEAGFHKIEEYMVHVEEYYDQLEMLEKIHKRRIYLASDDPTVIMEAKEKYPQYEIIGDHNVASIANLSTRYSDKSLNGIILDIHFLSHSDYLVCTFSSQVCRVAYEIMQSLHVDASDRFKSLDDIYYVGGQNPHGRIVVLPHYPKNPSQEIELKIGDIVDIAGNHWNGYSKGKNRRTYQIGLFPSYKTEDIIEIVKFP